MIFWWKSLIIGVQFTKNPRGGGKAGAGCRAGCRVDITAHFAGGRRKAPARRAREASQRPPAPLSPDRLAASKRACGSSDAERFRDSSHRSRRTAPPGVRAPAMSRSPTSSAQEAGQWRVQERAGRRQGARRQGRAGARDETDRECRSIGKVPSGRWPCGATKGASPCRNGGKPVGGKPFGFDGERRFGRTRQSERLLSWQRLPRERAGRMHHSRMSASGSPAASALM